MRPQSIYFIQCNGTDGPIKIGIAVDPNRRLSELRIGCPYPMQMLATCPGDDMLERQLHATFRDDRIHGEWFTCTPKLLELARDIRREMSTAMARSVLDQTTAPGGRP